MYDPEIRVVELTRALENLVECFVEGVEGGGSWSIPTEDGGLTPVDSDVERVLEHAIDILYNEEEDTDIEEDRYLTDL